MTGVELVRDRVEYPADGVVVEMDVALVFRTKHHSFAFSRGIWFSDIIGIEISSPEAQPEKLASVDGLWVEGEDRVVRATREAVVL